MEEIDFQETKRMEQGKTPRITTWGNYDEELPHLEGMMDRIGQDFTYIRTALTAVLTDPKMIEQEKENNKKMDEMMKEEGQARVVSQRQEMGAWVSDYFDDAGYVSWHMWPQIYKAMIMNAFLPLDALDGNKIDMSNLDVENYYVKFMKVTD